MNAVADSTEVMPMILLLGSAFAHLRSAEKEKKL
jgi:hypothetical protein